MAGSRTRRAVFPQRRSRPARRLLLGWLVLIGLVTSPVALSQDGGGRLLRFDRYHRARQIGRSLVRLQESYPAFTALNSMGRSAEGRELWVLTIRNPLTGSIGDKTAVFVEGNSHGNEPVGAEICLHLAETLLSGYATSPRIRRLVDERVFFIAPSLNPDAREAFLRGPAHEQSNRRSRRPRDDDNDGLVDEDGPEDLDGDGEILQMRVRDPAGRWTTAEDGLTLRRCRPDEAGEFRLLGLEGRDRDGDGKLNEDPVGGVDLNRNFPSHWRPESEQPGAGDYPLSEPETRAVATFLKAHPNIAVVQSFHSTGGWILTPPAVRGGRGRGAPVPKADREMFAAIGKRGEGMLPGYESRPAAEALYDARGSLLDWAYFGLGAWSFTNEVWRVPRDFDRDGVVTEGEEARWCREMLDGEGYRPWKTFRHPELGEVELGGWTRMARRAPPVWLLPAVCHRNTRFVLYHAGLMPRLIVRSLTATRAPGEDLWRVEMVAENTGSLPTATMLARRQKRSEAVRATLFGGDATVIASGASTEAGAEVQPEAGARPERVSVEALEGLGRVRIVWLVRGKGRITASIRAPLGGRSQRSALLGR